MAKAIVAIPPFPDHIDRRDFGNWLSGFVDGEGHFGLRCHTQPMKERTEKFRFYSARFAIGLRDDDAESLQTIQSFWRCGTISFRKRPRTKIKGANPGCEFSVTHLHDLVATVVPHFESYPLLAKKRTEFHIWREAVQLLDEIKRRHRKSRGFHRGTFAKWTDTEHEQFVSLHDQLHRQRSYKSNGQNIRASSATVTSPSKQRRLFLDGPQDAVDFTIPR